MRFYFKGFTSLLLSISFVGLAWSGVLLYLSPRGRVANWTGWTMMGLTKTQWAALHMNLSILVIIAAAVHLIFNWSMFWGYIKSKVGWGLNLKWEILAAATLMAVVSVGSVRDWPPFSEVMAWNLWIKDYWEPKAADAPAIHAEEFTLERLAANLGLAAEEVTKALQDEGLVVADTKASVSQIAQTNQTTPQAIHAAIRRRFPQAAYAPLGKRLGLGPDMQDHQPGMGLGKGRGMGKGLGKAAQSVD